MEENRELERPRRGRRPGALNKRTVFAREWAERVGVDPIEFMLNVLASDTVEAVQTDKAGKVVLDHEGKPVRELVAVPLELRIECAKTVAGYMYPRLNAQHISAEAPVAPKVTLDTMALLSDPKLAGAVTELAMFVALNGTGDTEARPPVAPHMLNQVIGD